MNAKPQSHSILFIGLDWADREHVCCLMSSATDKGVVETIRHEPEDIAEWVAGLEKRFPQHRVLVALEQSRGAVIAALAEHQELELYPINPRQLSSYRDSMFPSGSKNDPGDARLLADFLEHNQHKLRRWQPDAVETRRIAGLCELRRKLVEDRKRLVLQLKSSLKMYFPAVLKLVGRTLYSDLIVDLLRRWPTLSQLKRVKPQTLRTFLAEHGLRNVDRQTKFIDTARAAVPLTTDEAIIEPRALYVQILVNQIRGLNKAIDEFDEKLRQAVAAHPDQALFRKLPGAGDALVPRLIAAFGSDRNRYKSAEELQRYSGIAPVTRKSGNSWVVLKRKGCPKFLRQTFHEFADHARKWSRWAKAFYEMKRDAGFKHNAAVRALAYKWIRVIYHLWSTNTLYDEAHHIEQLTRRNSPVIQFLQNGDSQ
jgi:transposase